MSSTSQVNFVVELANALKDTSATAEQWRNWLEWEAARRPREWWRPLWQSLTRRGDGEDEEDTEGDEDEDVMAKWVWRNIKGSLPTRPKDFPTCEPMKDVKPDDVYAALTMPSAGVDDSKVAEADEATRQALTPDALDRIHTFAERLVHASLLGNFVREIEDSDVGRALIQLRGLYKVRQGGKRPAEGGNTPVAAADAVREQLETVGLSSAHKDVEEHKEEEQDAAVVVLRDALSAGAAPSIDAKGFRTTEERAFILRDWTSAMKVGISTALRRVQEYPPRGYREVVGGEVSKKKKPVKYIVNFLEGIAAGLDAALAGVRRGREQLLEQVQLWFDEHIAPRATHLPHDEPAW